VSEHATRAGPGERQLRGDAFDTVNLGFGSSSAGYGSTANGGTISVN